MAALDTSDLDKDIKNLRNDIERMEKEINDIMAEVPAKAKGSGTSPAPIARKREQVQNTRDGLKICVDMSDFKSDEIKVLVKDGVLRVEAKHEETETDGAALFKHLIQKYSLPQDVDLDAVTSRLNKEGILHVAAPKKRLR